MTKGFNKINLGMILILLASHVLTKTSDWPTYGNDAGSSKYAALDKITIDNVSKLRVAWQWESPDNKLVAENPRLTPWGFKSTPVKIGSTLFTSTSLGHVAAIDAKTGKLCEDFGNDGKVDLRKGLGDHPDIYYWSSSPPAIINERIIVGGSVIDNTSINIPGGVVRAYNIRTGDLEWYWDPVPPGMEINSSDNGNAEYQRGTANVWSIISTDPDLNLIYLPTGNASPDYYGGHREGLDYYNSSVVALKADTGEVAWHFKTVYHDVWDYDVPSQPTFYDIEKDGKTIKALAQTTKMGFVFLLNRETGEPIFPIEEIEVPQGSLEGEKLSKTQPFPSKPLPLNPTYFDPDEAYGFTFWDKGYCKSCLLYTSPSPRD